MNLRFIPILAVAFVIGCSKPAATGDVASKSSTDSSAVTTTPASSATTGGADTTSSKSPAPDAGTKAATPPSDKSPAAAPPTAPKGAAAAPASSPTMPRPGATGASQALTPQQQAARKKQVEDFVAKEKKLQAANAAKAATAAKAVLSGVKGTYKLVIDESKIPDQVKAQPGYADQLAKAKSDPPTIVVSGDGSVTVKITGQPDVTGFTSKVDGKPVLVLKNPHPAPGGPSKQFLPIEVKDAGATLQLGAGTFKRS